MTKHVYHYAGLYSNKPGEITYIDGTFECDSHIDATGTGMKYLDIKKIIAQEHKIPADVSLTITSLSFLHSRGE